MKMTSKEFKNLVISEAMEGKSDSEILKKLLFVEGCEEVFEEINRIRREKAESEESISV